MGRVRERRAAPQRERPQSPARPCSTNWPAPPARRSRSAWRHGAPRDRRRLTTATRTDTAHGARTARHGRWPMRSRDIADGGRRATVPWPIRPHGLAAQSLAQTAQNAALTTRQQGGGASSTVARRGQIARLYKEGVGRSRRLAAPTQQVRRPWLRSPELQRAAARVVRQFHTRIPPWRCKAVELARRLRACSLNGEAMYPMKTTLFFWDFLS